MLRRNFLSQCIIAAAATGCSRKSMARQPTVSRMPSYKPTGVKLITDSTPIADGYYYPAEWEKHEYTIMVMPPSQILKAYGIPLDDVRDQWADVANTLNEYEPVLMVVAPKEVRDAKRLLSSDIEIVDLPVNDGWARDSGPMYVVNGKGQRRVAGFTFNGWGAKVPHYQDDALLKARLCDHLKESMYPIDLVLEGGAVTVDGEGTLITTEQCLLHENRNSASDKAQVEKVLNESLGTKKVIWLNKGLTPDPITDGHVDGIAAFAEPGTVLLHTTDDKRDPNFKICNDARRRLQGTTDARGRKLEVIEVPLDGEISNINFYIANGCILVPITTDPKQDNRPVGILKEVFNDYKVIGIDSRILGEGGGGIHCITQQVPVV